MGSGLDDCLGVGRAALVLLLSLAGSLATAEASECRIYLVPGAFGARGSGGGAKLFLRPEDYFKEYRDFFNQKGCETRQVEFPADATIEERGQVLRDQVKAWRGVSPLYLIGHSQGALDARYALQQLKLQGVAGLVSIGAPHRGTPAAEWVVVQRDSRSVLYWTLRGLGGYDLDALRFAGELTPLFLGSHPAQFGAVAGVRYASAQGECRQGCHWVLRFAASWLGVGTGDGIVPSSSQHFGDELGSFNLDHISEVGVDPEKRIERSRFLSAVWTWMKLS